MLGIADYNLVFLELNNFQVRKKLGELNWLHSHLDHSTEHRHLAQKYQTPINVEPFFSLMIGYSGKLLVQKFIEVHILVPNRYLF